MYMKIKVYNQNGKVSVTKICPDGNERSMFSDVKNGEVVEIEVGTSMYTRSGKKKIDGKPEGSGVCTETVVKLLQSDMENNILDKEETELAINVLKNAQYGSPELDGSVPALDFASVIMAIKIDASDQSINIEEACNAVALLEGYVREVKNK